MYFWRMTENLFCGNVMMKKKMMRQTRKVSYIKLNKKNFAICTVCRTIFAETIWKYRERNVVSMYDLSDLKYQCQIPCGVMPIITETNFGRAVKTMIHPNRIANFDVLIYILAGEMEVIEDGVVHVLTADTLFFLKKGVHHWGERPYQKGTEWYYIHFCFPKLEEKMQELPDDGRNLACLDSVTDLSRYYVTLPKQLVLPKQNRIRSQMKQVVKKYRAGDIMRAVISLWNLILDCCEFGYGQAQIYGENAKIKQIIDYLTENFHENNIHAELEALCSLSFKYLSALLKEKTGKTIKQYQLELRLKEALELLCETTLPIAEISEKTGFYDEFYFSKIFKREFGMPPLKYRNNYKPRI